MMSKHCCQSSSVASSNAWVPASTDCTSTGSKPSPTARVHNHCTSTSQHRMTGDLGSISPWAMASLKATASRSSNPWVGTKWALLGAPGRCPLRPALCIILDTPLGPPIWTTASTGRKSTPRSREAVQTTARSLPSCRASSTHSRSSLAMDPWCIAKMPAHSGLWAKSAWYHTSACLRVLVKINVL